MVSIRINSEKNFDTLTDANTRNYLKNVFSDVSNDEQEVVDWFIGRIRTSLDDIWTDRNIVAKVGHLIAVSSTGMEAIISENLLFAEVSKVTFDNNVPFYFIAFSTPIKIQKALPLRGDFNSDFNNDFTNN